MLFDRAIFFLYIFCLLLFVLVRSYSIFPSSSATLIRIVLFWSIEKVAHINWNGHIDVIQDIDARLMGKVSEPNISTHNSSHHRRVICTVVHLLCNSTLFCPSPSPSPFPRPLQIKLGGLAQ